MTIFHIQPHINRKKRKSPEIIGLNDNILIFGFFHDICVKKHHPTNLQPNLSIFEDFTRVFPKNTKICIFLKKISKFNNTVKAYARVGYG